MSNTTLEKARTNLTHFSFASGVKERDSFNYYCLITTGAPDVSYRLKTWDNSETARLKDLTVIVLSGIVNNSQKQIIFQRPH